MSVIVLVLLWIAAWHRLRLLARAPNLARQGYAAGAAGIAAAYTMKLYGDRFDRATTPNLSDLIEHLFVVAAVVGVQIFLLSLRTGRPHRRQVQFHASLAACVLIAMTALFGAAPLHDTQAADFDAQYGGVPAVIAYKLLYSIYLAYVLAGSIALCVRYMKVPGDKGRTISLRLVSLGCTIALIYAASRVIYTVALAAAASKLDAIQTLGDAAIGLSLLTIALGILAPEAVPAAERYGQARQEVRAMRPLWTSLRQRTPDAVLVRPTAWTIRRAEFANHRMIVEIEDMLRLATIPQETAQQVAVSRDQLGAVADALRTTMSRKEPHSNGVAAADLLPATNSRDDERHMIRTLAERFAAAQLRGRVEDVRWQPSN